MIEAATMPFDGLFDILVLDSCEKGLQKLLTNKSPGAVDIKCELGTWTLEITLLAMAGETRR